MRIIHTRRGLTVRNPADPVGTQPTPWAPQPGTAAETAPAATPERTHTSPRTSKRGRGPIRAAAPLCLRNHSCLARHVPSGARLSSPHPAAGRAGSPEPARIGLAQRLSLGPGAARQQLGSGRAARSPSPGREPGTLPTSPRFRTPARRGPSAPTHRPDAPTPRRPSASPQPPCRSLPREPLATP